MAKKRHDDVVYEPILRAPCMRKLDQVLRAVAERDVTVTLIGESGTGKEILARRVHEVSGRRSGPFAPINCAAIPETLFESELFGHERGAFTGATERARGKIEAAEGGTLFLDEIGEMPIGVQSKLLRFLENRKYMRVGGSVKLQADVRLVFATLRPLADEVRAGRFRPDLFYRIQGITLKVPLLRERRADILPMITQFTAQLSAHHGTSAPKFSRAATAALLAYPWPGNVRELRNTVELLCLLRGGMHVRVRDLPEPLQEAAAGSASAVSSGASAPRLLTIDLDEPLDHIVERVIRGALTLEHGNRSRAAERLGVSLRTMQRYAAKGLTQE